MDVLETQLSDRSGLVIFKDVVRTERKPGWSVERHQTEHTKAFVAALCAVRLANIHAFYTEVLEAAETADWGPPKGWPENPELSARKKAGYLARTNEMYAQAVKDAKIRPLTGATYKRITPWPAVKYRDDSQVIASKYDGITFERMEESG